ncbi:MAG: pyruvate oxidoreductase subunit gamma [Archaeoglobi archaeon]|nr:pyruvate oxidoreductase subunit gamma [Archaeoglobi archaeon]
MREVVIYCRGGQGGITSARILARAALAEGYYSQAMPQFGAERRGASVQAYLRISETPIRKRSRITSPDTIAIFDRSLRVESDAFKIINSNNGEPNSIAVDASAIAVRLGLIVSGWPVVNTAMSGAMARHLGISLSSLEDAIAQEVGVKVEENIEAARIAYRMVR